MQLVGLIHSIFHSDFLWSEEIETIQKNVFKIPTLRAHQLPTMNATMSGIDCILIMPTGGGKSLCYQLPALASKGKYQELFYIYI